MNKSSIPKQGWTGVDAPRDAAPVRETIQDVVRDHMEKQEAPFHTAVRSTFVSREDFKALDARVEALENSRPEMISASNAPNTGQIPPFEESNSNPYYDYWENRSNYYEQQAEELSKRLEKQAKALRIQKEGYLSSCNELANTISDLRIQLQNKTAEYEKRGKIIEMVPDDAKLGALVRQMPADHYLLRTNQDFQFSKDTTNSIQSCDEDPIKAIENYKKEV